jgi:cell division cycle 14
MIFDDGTCPSLKIVRQFINLAHEMITVKKRGIAVHCKAGLGRTGCLIGAYLIYRHGFTANEIIAYMRFMRPGMVVGPQQHWLHLNQGTFRQWWFEDTYREEAILQAQLQLQLQGPLTPRKQQRLASNGQTFTPPNGSMKRSALGEINTNDQNALSSSYHDNNIGVQDENLPQPTPGQPRKTSKAYGYNNTSKRHPDNEPFTVRPDSEVVTMARHTQNESESEEEFQLRMLARRASRSPGSGSGREKRRAVSCTSTTITKTEWQYPNGEGMSDIENNEAAAVSPSRPKNSASGRGEIQVGKIRSSPSRRSAENKNGVRKTSGRVGSTGNAAVMSKAK